MEAQNTPKKSKFANYVSKHKMVTALLILLVSVSIAAFVKIKIDENTYAKKVNLLERKQQLQMEQLQLNSHIISTKALSWAVRSELMRDNKDQANQYLTAMIKENGVSKISFIDAKSNKIILATDKKDEGAVFPQQYILLADSITHTTVDAVQTIYCPVMGLNSKLGVLIVEFDRSK